MLVLERYDYKELCLIYCYKKSHKIVKGYFSYAMNSVLSQNNENNVCASGLSMRISNLSKTLNKKDRKCELYYLNGTAKTRMCTKYTSR